MQEYFTFIKEKENDLWVATFADVTKYIKERKNIDVNSKLENGSISLTFSSDLNPKIYNVPLTFKTYIPGNWKSVKVMRNDKEIVSGIEVSNDELGNYIIFNASPLQGKIVISASV